MESKSPNFQPSPEEARALLGDLENDGTQLAKKVVTPAWYHPTLGAIIAIIIAGQVLPGAYPMVVILPGLLAMVFLQKHYEKTYGVAVTKTPGRHTRKWLAFYVLFLAACIGSGLILNLTHQSHWWILAPIVVAYIGTVALGRRYDDALRQDILELSGPNA